MESVVVYCSKTGFTKSYAEQLAEMLGGRAVALGDARGNALRNPDVLIFGTRAFCGTIYKLKAGARLLRAGAAGRCALFVTGAAPAEAEQTIDSLWRQNLPRAGLESIPHFYLPAGLCYENMGWGDRMMMRGLASMLRHKRQKTEADTALEERIRASFDLSDPDYLQPVVSWARGERG